MELTQTLSIHGGPWHYPAPGELTGGHFMLGLFQRRRGIKSLDSSADSVGPPIPVWAKDSTIPDEMRDEWIQNGLIVLHCLFDSHRVDEYNATVAKGRSQIDDGKDQYGYGDRVGQLHQKYNDLLELAHNDRIIRFLAWAFGDKPIVFGSLNFDRGTTQAAHIDAIFFCPQPNYSMAGVWVATEDIHPDSGPLFYIPGSHQWPLAHGEDVVTAHTELAELRIRARASNDADKRSAVVSQLSNAWSEDFARLLEKRNAAKVILELKKGDAVVWHSHLAHGGQPRNNPALSRRSAVFHFIGSRTKLYTFEQFFLFDRGELVQQKAQPLQLGDYKGLKYMRYPSYVSYSDGKELHHKV